MLVYEIQIVFPIKKKKKKNTCQRHALILLYKLNTHFLYLIYLKHLKTRVCSFLTQEMHD